MGGGSCQGWIRVADQGIFLSQYCQYWHLTDCNIGLYWEIRDSLLVRAPDSWSKGCEFESRQERRKIFFLQSYLCVLTLIRCPFHPRVTPVILPNVQVAGYTKTRIHLWPNEVGVGWLCLCPDIVWEPFRIRTHTQLVREHSATVVLNLDSVT